MPLLPLPPLWALRLPLRLSPVSVSVVCLVLVDSVAIDVPDSSPVGIPDADCDDTEDPRDNASADRCSACCGG